MKFNELQVLALRKLQVKLLPQKLKNLTPKATYPTPNQHHLYTMPGLRVGRSAYCILIRVSCKMCSNLLWLQSSVKYVYNINWLKKIILDTVQGKIS